MSGVVAKAAAAPAQFARGFSDPWRALGFLFRTPSLWPLAIMPFVIGLLVYAGSIWAGWHFMSGWLEGSFFDQGEGWSETGWQFLGYLIAILFWIVMLLAVTFLFVPLSTLIANPFNDLLSEKTERLYRGAEVNAPFTLAALWRSLHTGLAGEIRRFISVTFLLIAAFALNLIPVAGQALYTIASTMITINFLSLEYTSFSMDRRLYTWDQKKRFLRGHRARSWGFGAMAMLILMVPLVNAFFIPISAIAGTMLFCDTELEDAAAKSSSTPSAPPLLNPPASEN